jgi:hypothetical protein
MPSLLRDKPGDHEQPADERQDRARHRGEKPDDFLRHYFFAPLKFF